MQRYSEFRPTGFDTRGLGLADRQDWLVVCVSTNRDADSLTRSNWEVVTAALEKCSAEDETGSFADFETHSFGHWACGWFEIALVRPGTEAAREAERWEAALAEYPVADENHHSDLEWREACEFWAHYPRGDRGRLEYIADRMQEFEFQSFSDMWACVKGRHFCGSASELLGE